MPIVKKGTKDNDTLEGTGDLDDLYGYAGADVLIGLGENDHLDGGGNGDTMIGGLGDDHYYVDNALDNVIENASARAPIGCTRRRAIIRCTPTSKT